MRIKQFHENLINGEGIESKSICYIEGWGAALAVGVAAGGIASAAIGASATSSAANEQASTAANQVAVQQQENNQIVANLSPYNTAGQSALKTLTSGFAPGGQYTAQFTPGAFQSSPEYAGYQFEQEQGLGAEEAAAASKGQTFSPATAAAIDANAQGVAETQYSNWYDQAYTQWLNSQQTNIQGQEYQASLGESAAAQAGTQTQVGTGNELQAMSNAADASTAATIQEGKNITGLTGSLTSTLTSPQMLNAYTSSSVPDTTSEWMDTSANEAVNDSNLFSSTDTVGPGG